MTELGNAGVHSEPGTTRVKEQKLEKDMTSVRVVATVTIFDPTTGSSVTIRLEWTSRVGPSTVLLSPGYP